MKTSIKIANLLFALGFFAFLALIGVGHFALPEQTLSVYENRALADYPALQSRSVADGRYFTDLEKALCDHTAYRDSFLRLKTGLDLALGRPVVNTVVNTGDGIFLPYQEYTPVDEQAIQENTRQVTDQLAQMQALVEGYGGTFLYVIMPDQATYYAQRYPAYLNDGTQKVRAAKQAFLTAADQKGIHLLDIEALWAGQGNPRAYVSGEDHHLTFEGGQQVHTLLLEALGMEQTVEFEVTQWQAPLFGSRVIRLCDLVAPTERLRYATPTQWIPFTKYNWGNDTPAYENTIALPPEGESIRYGSYMGGDVSETVIQTNRPQLNNVMMLGDSFTNLQETMLYTEFNESRFLDLRHYSQMSAMDYVQTHRPDVVIIMRDAANLAGITGNGNLQ